jgi:hypothetical protein
MGDSCVLLDCLIGAPEARGRAMGIDQTSPLSVLGQPGRQVGGSNVPPKGTWNSSIESCPLWCFRYICGFQQL